MLADMIKTAQFSGDVSVKVANVRTIADAMEKTYRGMLSKIDSNSRNSRKIIFIPVKNQNLLTKIDESLQAY